MRKYLFASFVFLAVFLITYFCLRGSFGDDESHSVQAPIPKDDSRAISQAELDGPNTSLDRVPPNAPTAQPQVPLSQAKQTTRQEAKHFRAVLTLKFGEKKFLPGHVFHIVPQKDEIITGKCTLKFDCQRLRGRSATKYRPCTAIVTKSGTKGEMMMAMSHAYVRIDGKWIRTRTWPASQAEKKIGFPVSFFDSAPFSQQIHGTGWVYFFLDDGNGKVLSNIISVEANVPR